jgi:hypothetical protein
MATGGRVLDWVRQTACGVLGHDNLMQFEHDRLFLRCASCGHESPGWSLVEPPPSVKQQGGERRRMLVAKPRLMSARRVA